MESYITPVLTLLEKRMKRLGISAGVHHSLEMTIINLQIEALYNKWEG